ncbi:MULTISPECIES: 4-aminobutyrate--2-oxoglutarate transaminase [Paraburkholderia]|uniref:4-aminobutyrate aminotransferase/4-aminobutyrate aminotransferase/(S)-3-amino-2-methylpropionate transaminase n=1 Tax=Paraburkholderia caledonica TaxID=134536 RepID=A0AB73IIS5_9BURK|nr:MULTISPECIES: 4-aminobutyrate--2-oxoglutarate transaminase [Paraburkholderia]MDP9649034.1 4-aminobutyrate aminotransferase/4-aminobutyrate aminotransferase/(S)-3-amino-2-methylpropionate transaminase [Paraburkholderia caledonica]MDR6378045.1 4-aminobutyrate aminotransferase/4-aminobutyrate aminotransferase/(S)-3-amino-2-methylpropionate transaminase [Paraburkholderia caledonica]MDR7005374.1 4-aminobutyrate aminotransferase/4-aminobutyrate aminotransferase/(S)-3-amino-2-methylpropionate transa
MNLKNAELKSRKDAATPRGVGVMCDFYAERAQNAELWDVEGRRFIDFAAGIAVCNTGHRHPKIVAAIRDQLDRFTHTAYQIVPYASYVELAEKLNERAPGDHPKKTAFFTTGAEAVENAIKIARAATGRPGVIAFTGGFHGRTLMGMALTGKVAPYKAGFGPFPSDVFHAPFPNPLHGVSTADSLKAIEFLFKADIDPKRVAAIIFEPVQGEGGFYPAPAEFVRALRKLCNEHGILLIADEVQTGFARTGKLFAMHHYDVVPDLMTVAKSLAGGMPLSGVIGRADVMDAAAPGGLGGTYAGNPLAVAAALAVLDIIDEEKLCERATILGDRVKAKLIALQNEAPQIADVRGPGGMVAVEFCKPGSTEPDAEFTKRVQTRALERGLLLLVCGVYSNVVRFLFPLTIEDTVFDEALAILEDVIKDSVAVAA